jgi:hypothetical protein
MNLRSSIRAMFSRSALMFVVLFLFDAGDPNWSSEDDHRAKHERGADESGAPTDRDRGDDEHRK